jgi:hypothetical protein
MENWFLADRRALEKFFGQGFLSKSLPNVAGSIELISKANVLNGLKTATKRCETKEPYDKGDHSFEILGQIDPKLVAESSPWAKRFIEVLKNQPAMRKIQ